MNKEKITSLIWDRLENEPEDRVFIRDCIDHRQVSYLDFYGDTVVLARVLEGLQAPETLFLIMRNCYELAALYFACILTGRVASPIDPGKGEKEIRDILAQTPAAMLVCAEDHGFSLQRVIRPDSLGIGEHKATLEDKTEFWARLRNADLDKLFLLSYTSGTSGMPKGVKNSFRNLLLNSEAFMRLEKISSQRVFLHCMPMTYMAGILNTLILPFVCGASIVIAGAFDIGLSIRFWTIVKQFQADTFWLSPTMLAILAKIDSDGSGRAYCDQHGTHWYIGTAPLSGLLKMKFENQYGVRLYQSYGLSETLIISAVNQECWSQGDDSSVGHILDGARVMFCQDEEILLDAPWMFLGYSNEDTDAYFLDGMYRSGDIGRLEQGALVITDRKKDLIIRGGLNISPKAIENAVCTIMGVQEAAVVAQQDPMMGETILCAVVLEDGFDVKTLKKQAAPLIKQLGTGYTVDRWVAVAELPRTFNGKINKRAIGALQ